MGIFDYFLVIIGTSAAIAISIFIFAIIFKVNDWLLNDKKKGRLFLVQAEALLE